MARGGTISCFGFTPLGVSPGVAETRVVSTEHVPFDVTAGWESILEGRSRERLETVDLLDYLPKQRWFAGKSRRIQATKFSGAVIVESRP